MAASEPGHGGHDEDEREAREAGQQPELAGVGEQGLEADVLDERRQEVADRIDDDRPQADDGDRQEDLADAPPRATVDAQQRRDAADHEQAGDGEAHGGADPGRQLLGSAERHPQAAVEAEDDEQQRDRGERRPQRVGRGLHERGQPAGLPVAHEGERREARHGDHRQGREGHVERAVLHDDVEVRVELRQQRRDQQDARGREHQDIQLDGPTSRFERASGLHEADDRPPENARAGRAPAQSDSLLAHLRPRREGSRGESMYSLLLPDDAETTRSTSSVVIRNRVRIGHE